jgi:tetratricopeptide (TPR) repeat protein
VSGLSYLLAFEERYPEALGTLDRYLGLSLTAEGRGQGLWWKGFYLDWLGRRSQALEALRQAQEVFAATGHVAEGAVHRLMFLLYFEQAHYESARQSVQSYVDWRIKARAGSHSQIISVGLFFAGLCDLGENQIEAAKSKLERMKILLQDASEREKEEAAENISLLQMEINLAEGAVEEALSNLKQHDPNVGNRRDFWFIFTGRLPGVVMNNNANQFKEALARAYIKKGELDRAIAEYERLVAPDPAKSNSLIYPRFYYSLGKLYENKGAKDKARKQYRRFLELWKDADPGTAEVEDAKARLAGLS